MATQLANLTGDLSDIVDQDFVKGKATVRIRANTDYVVDPDNDKIRVLELAWIPVEADGTFAFNNLVAAADTVVPGTLQYYLDVKIKGVALSALGPYVLTVGDQDVTDLIAVPPVQFNSTAPVIVDSDVLTAAEAYIDSAVAAHVADPSAHPQYARIQNVAGAALSLPIIFAKVGDPFPPVTQGAILIYGGV